MPVKRLAHIRSADRFKRDVNGIINVLEGLEDTLSDPDSAISADDLMYIHFDADARCLEEFLADQQKVATFRSQYPGIANEIIAAAQDMIPCLYRLHEARQQVLQAHRTPDGTDIIDHRLPDLSSLGIFNLKGRAQYVGLTEEQAQILLAQITPNGHMILGGSEKKALLDAITGEMDGPRPVKAKGPSLRHSPPQIHPPANDPH